jgi:ribosomal protein S18 acetylase RimI-like enzyme
MSVSTMREGDREEVISTLVLAFVDDPVERWLFPDPEQYSRHFPEFVAAFASEAFERRTVWTLGDLSAVAAWLPPGAQPDGDAIVAILSRSVSPTQHADMFSVLDQMDEGHPAFPHWYLPWLGVRPTMQGAGLGGQLLKHCLTKVDADHVPAFLETPNPRTVSFYERHGFKVTAVAQAGACPPITLMLRASR